MGHLTYIIQRGTNNPPSPRTTKTERYIPSHSGPRRHLFKLQKTEEKGCVWFRVSQFSCSLHHLLSFSRPRNGPRHRAYRFPRYVLKIESLSIRCGSKLKLHVCHCVLASPRVLRWPSSSSSAAENLRIGNGSAVKWPKCPPYLSSRSLFFYLLCGLFFCSSVSFRLYSSIMFFLFFFCSNGFILTGAWGVRCYSAHALASSAVGKWIMGFDFCFVFLFFWDFFIVIGIWRFGASLTWALDALLLTCAYAGFFFFGCFKVFGGFRDSVAYLFLFL